VCIKSDDVYEKRGVEYVHVSKRFETKQGAEKERERLQENLGSRRKSLGVARDPPRIGVKRPLSDFIWPVQFLISYSIFCLTLTLRDPQE